MKHIFIKATCIFSAVVFSSGCANVEEMYDSVGSSISGAFSDRGNRYCLQAAGVGALAGGAAGAGIGYALGGGQKGAIIGGAIGAIGSAIGGCQYGIWVADRRKEYETQSEKLDAEIYNVSQTHKSLTEVNQRLRAGLAEREKQLVQIQSMQAQAGQARAAKEQLGKELAADRKSIEEQLKQAQVELDIHKKTLTLAQSNQAHLAAKSNGLKDRDNYTGKATAANALKDQPSEALSADEAAQVTNYKKRIAEMETAVSELRALNLQYATADSRVASL